MVRPRAPPEAVTGISSKQVGRYLDTFIADGLIELVKEAVPFRAARTYRWLPSGAAEAWTSPLNFPFSSVVVESLVAE